MLFEDRGVETMMNRTLTAIDASAKRATFATETGTEEVDYDYIHVIPPQRAPEFVVQSGLAWADKWTDQGWVECDMQTLRHLRYPEIFRAWRCGRRPKGKKTAASVKWQVPVVEDHLIAAIEGREGTETYNGYTSCPLITRIGRAMLVEFDYNNNLVPSFPGVIAPLEELWISWLMKEVALKSHVQRHAAWPGLRRARDERPYIRNPHCRFSKRSSGAACSGRWWPPLH
ncbi:hypothetical protein ACFOHS_20200 [Jhaorihella thermophila]